MPALTFPVEKSREEKKKFENMREQEMAQSTVGKTKQIKLGRVLSGGAGHL